MLDTLKQRTVLQSTPSTGATANLASTSALTAAGNVTASGVVGMSSISLMRAGSTPLHVGQLDLPNGGWTWWVRPRAFYNGTFTYVGSVRDNGWYGFDVIAADYTTARIIRSDSIEGPPGDDHNNPSIVAVAGKPLLMFYSEHNVDRFVHLFKMPWNGDQPPVQGAIPTPAAYGWGTSVGPTNNFASILPDSANNTIHMFSTVSNHLQAYARSENWGTDFNAQSPATPTYWLDFGATFQGSSNSFGFVYYRQLDSDPTKCRALCAAGYEGGRALRYCEINLATGDITKSDGTVLGNLRTGLNLPLSAKEADSPLELVYQAGAGACLNYATDILGGTLPEGVFKVQDLTTPDTTSAYYWCQRNGTTWTVEQIVNAGPRFTNSASIGYHSGAQFLAPGSVILGRATSGGFVGTLWKGNWQLEQWTRQSANTWTSTVLQTDPTFPLVRGYPVEGGGPFTYAYSRILQWVQYNNFSGDIILV
jgi:hypothetical protein